MNVIKLGFFVENFYNKNILLQHNLFVIHYYGMNISFNEETRFFALLLLIKSVYIIKVFNVQTNVSSEMEEKLLQ